MPRLETPRVDERAGWVNAGLLISREVTEDSIRSLTRAEEAFRELWSQRCEWRVPSGSYRRAFVAAAAFYGGRNVVRVHGLPGQPAIVVSSLDADTVARYHRRVRGNGRVRAEAVERDRLVVVLEEGPPELRPSRSPRTGGGCRG